MNQENRENAFRTRFNWLRFLVEEILDIKILKMGDFLREEKLGPEITKKLLQLLDSHAIINFEVSNFRYEIQ